MIVNTRNKWSVSRNNTDHPRYIPRNYTRLPNRDPLVDNIQRSVRIYAKITTCRRGRVRDGYRCIRREFIMTFFRNRLKRFTLPRINIYYIISVLKNIHAALLRSVQYHDRGGGDEISRGGMLRLASALPLSLFFSFPVSIFN